MKIESHNDNKAYIVRFFNIYSKNKMIKKLSVDLDMDIILEKI
jgi:hypothetical protein